MDSLAQRDLMLTIEEYLALEETSTARHEYIDGHIHALAGVKIGMTTSSSTS